MKRILFLIAFLLCAQSVFALPAPVSGHYVDSVGNADAGCDNDAGDGFTACVLPSIPGSTTVGHYLLIYYFACEATFCAAPSIQTISFATAQGDSSAECYQWYPGSDTYKQGIAYIKVATGGSGVVTATVSGGLSMFGGQFMVLEVSGIKSSSPCDTSAGIFSDSATGTSVSSTETASTTECNEFIFGYVYTVNTFTGTGGTTKEFAVASYSINITYKVGSSSTTQAETVTGTNSSSSLWGVGMAVFKSSDGTCGSGDAPKRLTLMGVGD